jgi:tetratricopeptide (TPR) repeat protein
MSAAATARSGRPDRRQAIVALLVSALCVASALGLQAVREAHYRLRSGDATLMWVQSGASLNRLALSYRTLLADLYWIRAIQHYGDTQLSTSPTKQYSSLYPLLDLATTLDPRFTIAYRFGAIFLAEPFPDGAGRVDQAIALLNKGLAAEPRKWQYAQDAGFVYYWWVQDYKQAAMWFDKAGRIEGAPWWLRSLAATTLVQGGDRRSSRALWMQLYETADDDWIKTNARLKLAQLDALDEIDQLAALVTRYQQIAGRFPVEWEALRAAGLLSAIPSDPSGASYLLDATQPGGVTIARSSKLYPLPAQFVRKAGPPS